MASLLKFPIAPVRSAEESVIEQAFENLYLGRRNSTVSGYKRSLAHWRLFIGLRYPSESDVLRYVDHARHSLNHCNKTIRKALVLLKKAYATLGHDKAFLEALRLVKVSFRAERNPTRGIPFERVMDLVECPDVRTPHGRRDRAHIALLLGGGLRLGETLRLRIGDIKESVAGTLFLSLWETKSGVPQEQAISAQFSSYILAYKAERLLEGATRGDPFLVSYHKNGTLINVVRNARNCKRSFKTYAKRLGLNISTHSCRATAITKLLADGLTYREVQEFSRHSSIKMVELYDKREFGVDNSPARYLKFEVKK